VGAVYAPHGRLSSESNAREIGVEIEHDGGVSQSRIEGRRIAPRPVL
jgi:hypothetical protein